MFFNSEGFIAGILPTAQAAYYCRDAQGNITSAWRVDAGYPYQTTHCYADGLLKSKSFSNSFQPYLYSGKELMKMYGYDCYDYGARHSYTALGHFTTPDPLAAKFYDTSPYVLCGGNLVRYVDPDGRWPWENENIQKARIEAARINGTVQFTDGQYGKDAVIYLSNGEQGLTYYATESNQRSAFENIVRTADKGGHADPFNIGTTTVSDVRAVADYCEAVSDVCDATAVGLAVTGVGLPAAGALAKAGTIAETVSDGINIGVDLYEGKNFKARVRIIGNLVSYNMSRITKTNNPRFEIVKNIFFDKIFNYIANKIEKKSMNSNQLLVGILLLLSGAISIIVFFYDEKKKTKFVDSVNSVNHYNLLLFGIVAVLLGSFMCLSQ